MSLLFFVGKAVLAASFARRAVADCVSYGMDFQDGGSYFQNNASTDPFTFVSQYEGESRGCTGLGMLLTWSRLQERHR